MLHGATDPQYLSTPDPRSLQLSRSAGAETQVEFASPEEKRVDPGAKFER